MAGWWLGPLVADYLVAQVQALVADPRVSGCCHGPDLVAALPAQAAPPVTGLVAHPPDRGDGRAGRRAGRGQHRADAVGTTVADAGIRPGDQLLDLLLVLPAERARQAARVERHVPTVPRHRVGRCPSCSACAPTTPWRSWP